MDVLRRLGADVAFGGPRMQIAFLSSSLTRCVSMSVDSRWMRFLILTAMIPMPGASHATHAAHGGNRQSETRTATNSPSPLPYMSAHFPLPFHLDVPFRPTQTDTISSWGKPGIRKRLQGPAFHLVSQAPRHHCQLYLCIIARMSSRTDT